MLCLLKYNAGNIQSVAFALERLGANFKITNNVEEISTADKVIFPGVGEASSTMEFLKVHNLDKLIRDLKQPVLGICLGMQLMCDFSEENNTKCLGIFNETVKKFQPDNNHKVPHMGWNQIYLKDNWMDSSLEGKDFYFVHSYYVPVNESTSAVSHHQHAFSAAMKKNNFYAVQFHPEKSAEAGELVLKNFLQL